MGENGKYDIESVGIELVNLNGVAFSHFANMFNSEADEKNLKTRCSLITDDDRAVEEESDEIASRAKIAKELERKNLKVFLAEQTFEFELFIAGKQIFFERLGKLLFHVKRIGSRKYADNHALQYGIGWHFLFGHYPQRIDAGNEQYSD